MLRDVTHNLTFPIWPVQDLLFEAYSWNPGKPTLDNFVAWLLQKGFGRRSPRSLGQIVRNMNAPGQADLDRLCDMLHGPIYVSRNRPARRCPLTAASRRRVRSVGHPAVLLCGVTCNRFYFQLFVRGKVPKQRRTICAALDSSPWART